MTFGHAVGDLLLIEVARPHAARYFVPENSLRDRAATRFLGLQMSGNHPSDAQAFAERITAAVLATPFRVHDHIITLTASIGYSIFPIDFKGIRGRDPGIEEPLKVVFLCAEVFKLLLLPSKSMNVGVALNFAPHDSPL